MAALGGTAPPAPTVAPGNGRCAQNYASWLSIIICDKLLAGNSNRTGHLEPDRGMAEAGIPSD